MKNIALVALILVLGTGFLSAQTMYGARLGVNFANWSADDIEDNEAKIGFHLGGMIQRQINENVIFQPELLYTMKGVKFSYDDEYYYDGYYYDYEVEQTVSMNYIEVPMLFKYNMQMSSFMLQPYIGPSVGLLMSAKIKTEVDVEGEEDSETTDIKDDCTSLELGAHLGVDAVLNEKYVFGLRYNYGLSNIWDGEGDDVFNRGFMLTAGMLFQQ